MKQSKSTPAGARTLHGSKKISGALIDSPMIPMGRTKNSDVIRGYQNCNIVRTRKTQQGTLDLATGKLQMSPARMATKPCNAPLFSRREAQTGVCRSCASGYSVTGNHFADEEQRKRAVTAHDVELQPQGA